MNTPQRSVALPAPAASAIFPYRLHEDDAPHFHDIGEEEKAAIAEALWRTENVELTTVGIDIGSSTSHLMFSRVHLQRRAQLLSSRFTVVSRSVLWRSPILLTPFLPDFTIDAQRLRAFVEESYAAAGLSAEAVDSGAVILTGEAIKRWNAEAIARIFAAEAGKFVCASAGHHLECALAAHGGGAVALSRRTHRTILNVDIGGGTTKFALIRNGEIVGTCAIAAGGRLIAQDEAGRLVRVEGPALEAAQALGFELGVGEKPDPENVERLVEALSEVVIGAILGQPAGDLGKALLLTAPLATGESPHFVAFTGGVSEYIFGRESRTFGDIARPLADRILGAFEDGRMSAERIDPGQGIRATVIGASQFSVQLSGTTIHISEGVELPLRNVPVVMPALAPRGDFEAETVARAIRAALERVDADVSQPIALALHWHGEPYHHRLHTLAEGIRRALDADGSPSLVLVLDGDVGRLLGQILEHELRLRRPVISIDGIELREFDYVDIGEPLRPTNAVPAVIKSLLFPAPYPHENDPVRNDDHSRRDHVHNHDHDH